MHWHRWQILVWSTLLQTGHIWASSLHDLFLSAIMVNSLSCRAPPQPRERTRAVTPISDPRKPPRKEGQVPRKVPHVSEMLSRHAAVAALDAKHSPPDARQGLLTVDQCSIGLAASWYMQYRMGMSLLAWPDPSHTNHNDLQGALRETRLWATVLAAFDLRTRNKVEDVLVELFAERVLEERSEDFSIVMQGGHLKRVRDLVCSGVATQKKGERVCLYTWSSYLEVASQWLSVRSLHCLLFAFVCLNQGWLSKTELDNIRSGSKGASTKASSSSSSSNSSSGPSVAAVRKKTMNTAHVACLHDTLGCGGKTARGHDRWHLKSLAPVAERPVERGEVLEASGVRVGRRLVAGKTLPDLYIVCQAARRNVQRRSQS
eukprot:881519-Amphidinium_carterae.3